jgi:hypothetical protein
MDYEDYDSQDLEGYNNWGNDPYHYEYEYEDVPQYDDDYFQECPKCEGTCYLHVSDDLVPCPHCGSRGYIDPEREYYDPSIDIVGARDLVIEVTPEGFLLERETLIYADGHEEPSERILEITCWNGKLPF